MQYFSCAHNYSKSIIILGIGNFGFGLRMVNRKESKSNVTTSVYQLYCQSMPLVKCAEIRLSIVIRYGTLIFYCNSFGTQIYFRWSTIWWHRYNSVNMKIVARLIGQATEASQNINININAVNVTHPIICYWETTLWSYHNAAVSCCKLTWSASMAASKATSASNSDWYRASNSRILDRIDLKWSVGACWNKYRLILSQIYIYFSETDTHCQGSVTFKSFNLMICTGMIPTLVTFRGNFRLAEWRRSNVEKKDWVYTCSVTLK